MTARLAALLLVLALSACQTSPAPEDNFYRLLPVAVSPALPQPLREGGITVRPLRAEGLYAERPVVYADAAEPRLLHQYHYHLWLYPPAKLVQEQLAASLRQSNPGAAVVADDRTATRYMLTGRVLRFDRLLSVSGAVAAAEIELAVEGAGGGPVLLRKTYTAEVPAGQPTVGGFSQAMEQALSRIYAEFAADLQRTGR